MQSLLVGKIGSQAKLLDISKPSNDLILVVFPLNDREIDFLRARGGS
jgi:hypothetical protein